ncbi:hypothetical protein EXIGLDRAFT_144848 [Exidia glandulosa HHB12029]|uniref:Uncharacterized protein n=1 Tax=Exidia glandulosa HHB12029 TaxID=1314781 RepID=A0A166BFC4_EXIGL|nr:hypothetical protein EXIGLDRAFT_144848 [Exidia glandulosa HHB12029]
MAMYSRLFPVLACIPCRQLKEIAFLFGPASRTYATTSKLSSAVPEREQKIPRSNQKDDLIRSVKHILPPSVPMAEALTPQDLVVEDGESTVGYSGDGWRVLPNANLYHGGTEHASYNASASATFAFTGAVPGSDASVTFTPADQWTHDAKSYALTYHGGASFSFPFEGSHVSYFSDKNTDHGRFQVQIDNSAPAIFSSYSPTLQPVQLLFSMDVSPGRHVMTVKNLDDGKAVGADHFVFRPVAPSSPGSSSPAPVSRRLQQAVPHSQE